MYDYVSEISISQWSKKCASSFCREPANENKQSKETKTCKPKSYLIRQSFFHGGS